MSERFDELIATAELGEQARRFVESDLGKVMLGMAQQEVSTAQLELETVEPHNAVKITELQNKAKVGRFFEEWLAELVSKGNAALEVFKHESSD